MKIIYCNGTLDDVKDGAIDKLRAAGHEVIFYDIKEPKRKNMWFIRHFQMYEEILEMAEKADMLYFACPIGYPEAFLYELKTRPNLKAKICSASMFREVNRSKARSLCIKELLDMPQFAMMTFASMLVGDFKLPDNFEKVGVDKNKIMYINEPYNEPPELFKKITREEARNRFGILKDEIVLLHSGSFSFIKGADLFVEMLKYLPENIKVLFHSNRNTNTDPTLEDGLIEKAKENHKNMTIVEGWMESGQMAYFYIAADVVLCPHRKLYEYSLSGVPNMAALSKKPIIAPDFYFFNEIVKRFNNGVIYEPENPEAMAKAVVYCFDHYDEIMKNAKFEESLTGYVDGTDTPLKIIKRLGL